MYLLPFLMTAIPAVAQVDPGNASQHVDGKLTEAWTIDLELPGREMVVGETIIDDLLLVTTSEHRVYAVDVDKGFLRWIYIMPQTSFYYRKPIKVDTLTDDGPLMFVMRTVAEFVDPRSGDLIERVDLPLTASGPGVADVCRMYIGGTDGMLFALNWNPACGHEALVAWRVRLGGPVIGSPVLEPDGSMYVSSAAGEVFAADARTKRFRWAFTELTSPAGQLAVHPMGVDVASVDHRLYVVDRVTGGFLNMHRFSDTLTEGPSIADDLRFQYCRGEGVTAFTLDDDRRLWTNRDMRRVLSRDGDELFARRIDGGVMTVTAATGDPDVRVALSRDVRVALGSTPDAVFVLTPSGRLTRASMQSPAFARGANLVAAADRASAASGGSSDSANAPRRDRLRQLNDPLRSRSSRRP